MSGSTKVVPTTIVHATVVQVLQWEGLRKRPLGARGAAIASVTPRGNVLLNNSGVNTDDDGDDDLPMFHIIFYELDSTETGVQLDSSLFSVAINHSLNFIFEDAVIATFADNVGRYWSIQFESIKESDSFARYICMVKGYMLRMNWLVRCKPKMTLKKKELMSKIEQLRARNRRKKLAKHQRELETLHESVFSEWPVCGQDLAIHDSRPQNESLHSANANGSEHPMKVREGDVVKLRYAVYLDGGGNTHPPLDTFDGKAMDDGHNDLPTGVTIGKRIASVGLSKIGYKSRGDPDVFTLGDGTHMMGLELGILGMAPRSRRFLVLPPHFTSTTSGGTVWGPHVPPNMSLLVEVALVAIRPRSSATTTTTATPMKEPQLPGLGAYATKSKATARGNDESRSSSSGAAIASGSDDNRVKNSNDGDGEHHVRDSRVEATGPSEFERETQQRLTDIHSEVKSLREWLGGALPVPTDKGEVEALKRQLKSVSEQCREYELALQRSRAEVTELRSELESALQRMQGSDERNVKYAMSDAYTKLLDVLGRRLMSDEGIRQLRGAKVEARIRVLDQMLKRTLQSVVESTFGERSTMSTDNNNDTDSDVNDDDDDDHVDDDEIDNSDSDEMPSASNDLRSRMARLSSMSGGPLMIPPKHIEVVSNSKECKVCDCQNFKAHAWKNTQQCQRCFHKHI